MDEYLMNICNLLLNNYEEMRLAEADPKTEFMVAGAGVFTADDVLIDNDSLETARAIINKKDGYFDDYRSRAEFLILCKLAAVEEPEKYFELLMEACKELQTGKLYTESNNILSSMVLLDGIGIDGFERCGELAEKSKIIFKAISEGSKGIPSDMPFAVIAALNGRDLEDMIRDEKAAKAYFKKGIKVDNVTSPAMAKCAALTDGDIDERCGRVCQLASALKKAKNSVGQGRVNIMLTLASYLEMENDELVSILAETDAYLKQFKPFKGITGLEPEFRRLLGLLCVIIRLNGAGGDLSRLAAIMVVYITLLNSTRSF